MRDRHPNEGLGVACGDIPVCDHDLTSGSSEHVLDTDPRVADVPDVLGSVSVELSTAFFIGRLSKRMKRSA